MKWFLKKLFNFFFEVVEEETEVLDELDEVVNDVIEYVREEVFETATDKLIKVADWTKANLAPNSKASKITAGCSAGFICLGLFCLVVSTLLRT